MKTIEAYKCEITGGIYETEQRAMKSEFRSMMKQMGGTIPSFGSVSSIAIMEWLAGHLESGIYPNAFDKLKEALDYFEAHRKTISPLDRVQNELSRSVVDADQHSS